MKKRITLTLQEMNLACNTLHFHEKDDDSRYFIAKVASIEALKRSADSSLWACKDRLNPPQPRSVLTSALKSSKVILIFSVNNCHGWHGYAEVIDTPSLEKNKYLHAKDKLVSTDLDKEYDSPVNMQIEDKSCEARSEMNITEVTLTYKHSLSEGLKAHTNEGSQEECQLASKKNENTVRDPYYAMERLESLNQTINENTLNPEEQKETSRSDLTRLQNSHNWYYFPINWKVCLIKEFGEQCLSSKLTEHLNISDVLPLNKARNWQEVPFEVGAALCTLIENFYISLCEKRTLQYQILLDKQDSPFFQPENDASAACNEPWKRIVDKVEAELGEVIIACPFGSQRYNLSLPDSDTDMFIVYRAKTKDVLGFHPPKQTIKNSERESCDYTIHEVFRYAELLLSGDARCVETLFLNESTVVKGSLEWQSLRTGRCHFIHQETLNKYMRDAQGTRGTKQLKKWSDENPSETILPQKMCKLLYVIVRLLQNARDIVQGREICVFREYNSAERTSLMGIRQGDVTVEKAWEIIKNLEFEIERNIGSVPEKHKETERFLEDWLLDLRKKDFMQHT